jgi:alpha-tubulin suppressor-like RCC1 family protein
MIDFLTTSSFSQHNFIFTKDHEIYIFGDNHYNQFGRIKESKISIENIKSPTKFMDGEDVRGVVAAYQRSFILKRNGDLFGLGELKRNKKDSFGQFTYIIKKICIEL